MKTKMKTIMSVCTLMVLLYACKKDSVTLEPILDCMSIENGTAISDDCGDCHKWTVYNYVTHAVREVNDTITEVLDTNEMFASPNNPMNPIWNANCTPVLDCMSIENGTAISDDCGDCHKWTAYNYVTHAIREVNDTITEDLDAFEIFASPNNPMNPAWNANCTDCNSFLNGVAVVDSCGDCQGAFLYNFTTHNPQDIVVLGSDTTGAAAIVTAAAATGTQIMIILPEHPMNSYWNSGCK